MTRIILAVMAAAFVLAACGKKGDPLPPPGYENSSLATPEAPDQQKQN